MKFPTTLPPQHQAQHPGFEYEMNPLPIYDDEVYTKRGDALKDKVAIITGGDSGIGRAVAIAFAKQGANLVIVYFNEHKDAEETKELIEQLGQQCTLICGDISNPTFCQEIVSKTMSSHNKIDVLVNNAAVQYESKTLAELSEEQFDRTFKVNVYGTFSLTKAVMPHLQCGASIINTTSVVAFKGHESLIDYSMTKGALTAFTRSLSLTLAKAKTGIRVNAVAPGPIWTPFIPSTFDKQKTSQTGADTPIGRAGQPIECAGAYVFLASDCASYMTGQTIHVNGGEIING